MSFHLEKQPMTGDSSSRQRYISIDCSDVVSHSEKKNKKNKTYCRLHPCSVNTYMALHRTRTYYTQFMAARHSRVALHLKSFNPKRHFKKKWHLLKMITDRIRPLFRWQTDLNTFAHHRFWNIDEVLAVTTYTLYT